MTLNQATAIFKWAMLILGQRMGWPLALAIGLVRPVLAQTTNDEMLDAVVSRGTAVFSAKITFEFSSTTRRGEPEVLDESQQHTLSISGED